MSDQSHTPENSPCWERGYNFDTGHCCESCGGSLYIADNADGAIYDGNEYECHACGKHGSMTVYDDGEVCGHEFEDEAVGSASHTPETWQINDDDALLCVKAPAMLAEINELKAENANLRAGLLLAARWGISSDGYSASVASDLRAWIIDDMRKPAPTAPDYYPTKP